MSGEPAPGLDDGTYDVIVVDADQGRADGEAPSVRLTLAVLAGPHKGEAVEVLARGLARDPLDLLAEPASLVVEAGRPRFELG